MIISFAGLHGTGKSTIAKKIAKFEFEQDEKKIQLNGSKIVYKPEDRIKKAR